MTVNFRGYLFNDAGVAVSGATVDLLDTGTSDRASGTSADTTDSNGLWNFDTVAEGTYDVKVTYGGSVRFLRWDDQVQMKEIDIRNNTGNTTPAATFTNITNNADNDVAYFRSLRGTGADNDEMFIRYYMDDASSNTTEVARMTVKLISASAASEDSEIRWGVAVGGSIVDVLTISNTDAGATDLTFDVAGDVNLDADGGDIFFKDGGTTFGSMTNTSGNLIIKSGTTTALTFAGANVTAAGTIGSGAITSTGIVTGTGFTAGSAVLAEAELELLDGLTAGTAIASKVVTTDANIDTSGQRNLTITGDLTLSGGGDGALTFSNAGENSIKIPDNQASALIIEEANNAYMTFVTTNSGEKITVAKQMDFSAGFAVGSDANGDVIYSDGTKYVRLARGSDGDVLTLASSIPSWATPTTGDITGVTAGVGLSGGGSSGGVTLTLDLSELSTVTPADGDFFSTLDSDGANEQKTTTTALATLLAGTGLTASSSVIGVDASQTQITSV